MQVSVSSLRDLVAVLVCAAAGALVLAWRRNAAVRRGERRALQRAEQYLEIAGTAIVAFDRDARVHVANATVCKLLGRPVEQVIGSNWISLAVPESGRETSRRALAAVMAGTRALEPRYEHELVRADGSVRLLQWSDVTTCDHRGRITGLLKSGLDITDQRAAEAEARQAARDLEILHEIAHAVATSNDARSHIVEGVQLLTGGSVTSLLEPTEAGDALRVTATTSPLVADAVVPLGMDSSGAAVAFETAEPYFIGDISANLAVSKRVREGMRLSSAVFQPVLVDGRPAGVLVVAWADPVESLGSRSTRLVEVGAHEAAIALERAAGTRRLLSAALTDPLTGIANRRAFDSALADALARAGRQDRPLSVALLDLNGLKQLNDHEGHEAGDALLRDSATAWQRELRPSDVLARLGGDEFGIILCDCGPEAAEAVADRLRRSLRHPPGCGVGLARWDGSEDSASLLRRADRALYVDKAGSPHARAA
ncbi:MAG TPA: diguanylate cyclase [Gaiellales bacterium]